MRITVLGCGNAWSRKLGQTSFLVEQGDVRLVIDCGPSIPQVLDEMGMLNKITHYFVSHIHADHVGGLEEVAFRNYFMYRYKPFLLLSFEMLPTLWTNCLAGGLRNVLTPTGDKDMIMSLGSYFTVSQHKPSTWIDLGSGLFAVIYYSKHVGSKLNYSLLLRNEETQKMVLFTCDVAGKNALPYKASDLIFHDTTFGPHYPTTVHTHVEELFALPLEVQEKIYCVHYSDFDAEKRPILDVDIAPLRIAQPGQVLEI